MLAQCLCVVVVVAVAVVVSFFFNKPRTVEILRAGLNILVNMPGFNRNGMWLGRL